MSVTKRSNRPESLQKVLSGFNGVETTVNFSVLHQNDEYYPIRATYPIIDSRAMEHTMAAYSLYVAMYNQKARAENLSIRKQQAISEIWVLKNQPENWKALRRKFQHDNTSKKIQYRSKKHKQKQKNDFEQVSVWEYNQRAEAYNVKFGGPIIPLKKIPTIKQATEQVFRTMVMEYGSQLFEMKRTKQAANMAYDRGLYKMEVNAQHLQNTKGKYGLPLLDYCNDTILNHKNRLIEAGILINREYRGSTMGTKHHINERVLAVFDDFDKKYIYSENQLFIQRNPKKFGDTVLLTRANNKTKVNRAVNTAQERKKIAKASDKPTNVKGDFLNADIIAPQGTRAPGGKMQKSKLAPETKKTEGPEFFRELSAGKYTKSVTQDMAELQKEAMSGTLAPSEFRQHLFQELFKQFSKVYRNHPDYDYIVPNAWRNTFECWSESPIMKHKNGSYLSKATMLQQYAELLYVLTNRTWGVLQKIGRNSFTPTLPKFYLNPYANDPGSFMFWYRETRKNSVRSYEAMHRRNKKLKKAAKESFEHGQQVQRLKNYMKRYLFGPNGFEKCCKYHASKCKQIPHQDFSRYIRQIAQQKTA